MGLFDRFFSDKEEGTAEGNVRFLNTFQEDYSSMDAFMEDFFEIVSETIRKYNESNPVAVEELDKDQAYKAGGRWIYEANIKEIEDPEIRSGEDDGHPITEESHFKIIARQQPHYGIELSGNEVLIGPYLEALKGVLRSRGLDDEFDVIARGLN